MEESLEELDSIVETFEALLRITQLEAGARKARVSCGRGKHNTAFVRRHAAGFAAKHGCRRIHVLD